MKLRYFFIPKEFTFEEFVQSFSLLLIFIIFFIPYTILLVVSFIILQLMDVPRKLGEVVGFESLLKDILYSIVTKAELIYWREEYLASINTTKSHEEDIERWGLLRLIDLERQRVIDDLREGEQLIAIGGGVTSLVVANIFSINAGGLFLTIIAVMYSIVVSFRILVVEALSYSSLNNTHKPLEELAKMKFWNEGPLQSIEGIGIVVVSLIDSGGWRSRTLCEMLLDLLSMRYRDESDEVWLDEETWNEIQEMMEEKS